MLTRSSFAYGGEFSDAIEAPDWAVAASSVTGPAHRARGSSCDDASAAAVLRQSLVAIVCDGAGSVPLGGRGAAIVAQSIVDTICTQHQDLASHLQQIALQSLEVARQRLVDLATVETCPLHHFATTVVGCLWTPGQALLFVLGDGAALALRPDLSCSAICTGGEKEYINETFFLTDPNWHETIEWSLIDPPESVLLLTDGVSPFALDGHSVQPDFARPIVRYLRMYPAVESAQALQRLLASDQAGKLVADDKTVLAAVRRTSHERPSDV